MTLRLHKLFFWCLLALCAWCCSLPHSSHMSCVVSLQFPGFLCISLTSGATGRVISMAPSCWLKCSLENYLISLTVLLPWLAIIEHLLPIQHFGTVYTASLTILWGEIFYNWMREQVLTLLNFSRKYAIILYTQRIKVTVFSRLHESKCFM